MTTSARTDSFSIENLLQNKVLPPISEFALSEVERICTRDVSSYNEADVRAEIIDPLLRVLGYDKETGFSIERERRLFVLNKLLKIDYNLTLWKQGFWLIEAKSPRKGEETFGASDLKQALEYASHPEINAALVVLCDGLKIEIFDRESDLSKPIFASPVGGLSENITEILLLLSPWQVWFFEKRRIIKQIDRVFDREINFERVEEFRHLVDQRLSGKRSRVIQNFRDNFSYDAHYKQHLENLDTASTQELVDVHLFGEDSEFATRKVISNLVLRCTPSSFRVLQALFPDQPRDANWSYHGNSLLFLIELSKRTPTASWLPNWINEEKVSEKSLDITIKNFIGCCLNLFERDTGRQAIVLYWAAIERLNKAIFASRQEFWRHGELMHAVERFLTPETEWSQVTSSPGSQVLQHIWGAAMTSTVRMIQDCRDNRGNFHPHVACTRVKEIWTLERQILQAEPNYPKLMRERGFGQIFPAESTFVSFDPLGHLCLCILEHEPQWKEYAMQHHGASVDFLAALGSWQALEWLGLDPAKPMTLPQPDPKLYADRFFMGDLQISNELRRGYGYRS